MDNIRRLDLADVELNGGGVHRSRLHKAIGMEDVQEDRFGVRVFRDGQPVDLTGATVKGYFRNSAGETKTLTGTVSGTTNNLAYVTLSAACCAVPGAFTLAVKLTGGGVTSTMRIIDGTVEEAADEPEE